MLLKNKSDNFSGFKLTVRFSPDCMITSEQFKRKKISETSQPLRKDRTS